MERVSILVTSAMAFAAVLAIDFAYVTLIRIENQEAPNPTPYVPFFVAGYLAAIALLIAVAMVPRPEVVPFRVALRAGAAAGLLVLGLLAAFSIGLPIVIAGLLVLVALIQTRTPGGRWPGVVGGSMAIAVLLIGFQLTEGLLF
jgi:hypothetical protein